MKTRTKNIEQTMLLNVAPEPGHSNEATISTSKRTVLLTGFKKSLIEFRIRSRILILVMNSVKNQKSRIKIITRLNKNRKAFLGDKKIKKIVRIDGKYFWDLYIPGFPSRQFDEFIEAEINRIQPILKKVNRFSNIFLAVTKKCSLQCEHCFEWDALNGKEKLSLNDLKNIVTKFQETGTAQIQLTGGEPMLRVKDLAILIKESKPTTEFWILTSGFNLNLANALLLKNAGLTGIVVSIDHFSAPMHNAFRGFENSFEQARQAVIHSINVNLNTAISICVTKSFVSRENLMAYAEMAREMGVAFIQLLEPKAIGHYKGMDVLLKQEHLELLESFYLDLNFEKKYSTYPIVVYPGYHQRKIGCFAAGNRNLYVDTDGDIHACPFCQLKMGSILSENADAHIENLRSTVCHSFKNALI